jgi:DNA polymerase elongation subunit (family B)
MSYIDCLFDRKRDRIHVVGRDAGERYYTEYPASYVLYYDDPKGKFRSIYGTPVSRFSTKSSREFRREQNSHSNKQLYESDINPIFRCLADNYLNAEAPKLHTAFFDIEVDFDPERGYSRPDDPFTPITAITVYLDWLDRLVTFAMPPKHMSMETATEIGDSFNDTFMFEREEDLLQAFLEVIEDADVLSGWNSEGYDIPYTVLRITRILSKDDTRRLCLWDQLPKQREFERFGAEQTTFDLIGRVHMDYMQLYRKYTYEERHSYSLDSILDYEGLGSKTVYEGTLDQLYNQDFKKFIEYNRQDVRGLAQIDQKLQFLDLANNIAHENTVLLPTTMGAVAVTEQAIINEAHERGVVVPDRKKDLSTEEMQAAGAYVAHPKRGMHDWIGSVDINSLYPSVIRALNMGPETIAGQLRPIMTDQLIKERMSKKQSFAEAWEGLFATLEYSAVMNQEVGTEITIDWQSGESEVYSASEIWKMIFDSNKPWVLSANGTIFTYEFDGVIPGLLQRWYAERKEMQKSLKDAEDDTQREYWDKRQLVKKINLNSLYGAILNPYCRFFDKRIGQSTTLTGRSIAKHMDAYTNECITGKYDHAGEAIIYGDTDSCYFTAWPTVKDEVESGNMSWDRSTVIQLYNNIAEQVSDSFPAFMEQAFHSPRHMGQLIKCARELVASRGLFIKKKRYAVMVIDNEGKRLDKDGKPGKVKPMGLDLKRSDTPKVIQDFLSEVLETVLDAATTDEVIEHIREFKKDFTTRPGWEKGSPKRVNNLTMYSEREKKHGKINMPGHVRAAMNWNNMKRMNSDNYSTTIMDGMKVIVCKLKSNALGWTSIAYPTDETRLPEWFKELPFDETDMEATVIDKKLDNLLGVLGWDIASATNYC